MFPHEGKAAKYGRHEKEKLQQKTSQFKQKKSQAQQQSYFFSKEMRATITGNFWNVCPFTLTHKRLKTPANQVATLFSLSRAKQQLRLKSVHCRRRESDLGVALPSEFDDPEERVDGGDGELGAVLTQLGDAQQLRVDRRPSGKQNTSDLESLWY